jgi:hypothetical protein
MLLNGGLVIENSVIKGSVLFFGHVLGDIRISASELWGYNNLGCDGSFSSMGSKWAQSSNYYNPGGSNRLASVRGINFVGGEIIDGHVYGYAKLSPTGLNQILASFQAVSFIASDNWPGLRFVAGLPGTLCNILVKNCTWVGTSVNPGANTDTVAFSTSGSGNYTTYQFVNISENTVTGLFWNVKETRGRHRGASTHTLTENGDFASGLITVTIPSMLVIAGADSDTSAVVSGTVYAANDLTMILSCGYTVVGSYDQNITLGVWVGGYDFDSYVCKSTTDWVAYDG